MIEAMSAEQGTSKTTGKPYTRYVFTISGKSYSTFNKSIFEARKIGDAVKMTGTQDEQYFNMSDMILDDGSGGNVGIGETPAPIQPVNAPVQKIPPAKYEPVSMYVSYAKDIFVAIIAATEGKEGDVKLDETMLVQ